MQTLERSEGHKGGLRGDELIGFFESQIIFRKVLDAMARPGKIVELPDLEINAPTKNKFPCLVLLTFLDSHVKFKVLDIDNKVDSEEIAGYISSSTGSQEASVENSDFILIYGGSAGGLIRRMKKGSPKYPDESTTLIYDVESIGEDGVLMTLSGPGICSDHRLAVKGIEEAEITELISVNRDFPMGIDAIFSDKNGKVVCIPRSTTVSC